MVLIAVKLRAVTTQMELFPSISNPPVSKSNVAVDPLSLSEVA